MPLELHEENEGKMLVVIASGKLTREDYEHFVPEVDRIVQSKGDINILFDMHDFHGWHAAAMWEDAKFAFKHFHSIARLAVVGEKTWQKEMTMLAKPFTRAEVQYFNRSELEKAKTWLLDEHLAKR